MASSVDGFSAARDTKGNLRSVVGCPDRDAAVTKDDAMTASTELEFPWFALLRTGATAAAASGWLLNDLLPCWKPTPRTF
jgi:hypothetical protein